MYFQEVKLIKINTTTVFTINQDPFLMFANRSLLTLLFIGPSTAAVVKQELVYNLLPYNSTAGWLTIQQTSLNSLISPDGTTRATFSIKSFITLSRSLKS